MATDCVIGLGSNLGDRKAALVAAVTALQRLGRLRAVSGLYETEPVGPAQPRFLNAAARLATELGPRALLGHLQEIEAQAGRVRGERWGPRVLDLDILWMGGVRLDEPDLVIPHERLRGRSFALVPLLDTAPDATDPVSGERYSELEPARRPEGLTLLAHDWLPPATISS